jgi:oligopeptide/dipeptide ABC transporter ATP-binding protein
MDMSVMLITHNLGIVAMLCDRAAIMYAGKIVENAYISSLFGNPLHPYTKLLINCVPRLQNKSYRLAVIEGEIADPVNPPSGCRFHPRCPLAMEVCRRVEPEIINKGKNHEVSCLLYQADNGY